MTTTTALELIEELFERLEARDLAGALALVADDAVLVDPHYPQMTMEGRDAIERGLEWGLSSMEQFGFTTVHALESADGARAMLEIDTHHVLKGGKNLDFPQMFVVEASDGAITGLRAYEPYKPNGVPGAAISVSHLMERAKHAISNRR